MSSTPKNKLRLLMIVNVFNPDRGGGGAIFSDLAYGLAERGFDVTVRCAYPYYPEWKDKSGKNGFRVERYEDQGAHVERYYIFIPTRPNSLVQRLAYEASFLLSLMSSLLRGRDFDAVMVYCPLVGAVAFATLNRWLWRKPLWLNVQDLSADAAAASGIAKGKAIVGLLRAVQSFFFNQAQVWSSISPVMVQRLNPLRKRNQPLLYLPNWLNASMAEALQALPSESAHLPGKTLQLLYAGNIGKKQDLLLFCQKLQASSADFRFRIHGNGGGADEVRAWVEACGDSRFSFGGFMEEVAFAQALHETDFFVITEKSGSGGSFIPCKTISGLGAGRPILAICDGDSPLGMEIRETQAGPWYAWDQLDDATQMIATIHEEPERFAAWQKNACERALFYERDRVIERCAGALEAMVQAESGEPLRKALLPFEQ